MSIVAVYAIRMFLQENSYFAFYYVMYEGVAIGLKLIQFSELYTKYVNIYFFYIEIEYRFLLLSL